MGQQECDLILEEFRSGSSRMMISTDLWWARGIDVQSVSLVINYDLPTNRESYIKRWRFFTFFSHLWVISPPPQRRRVYPIVGVRTRFRVVSFARNAQRTTTENSGDSASFLHCSRHC